MYTDTHTSHNIMTHSCAHMHCFSVGDDAFINARAGLCIAAFLLSLSAVLSAVVALFLTILMPKGKI